YLSRILRGLERRGLVSKSPSRKDGRQSLLGLTARGRKTFATLDQRQNQEVAALLQPLSPAQRVQLGEAMRSIEALLNPGPEPRTPYILRSHQPGDMGWVVHRHGALYAQEYGWDEQFEALVAEIAAKFIQHFNPKVERCWIAEKDGAIAGLVDECIRFARQAGYKKITLWTQKNLVAATHIYQKAGFRLVHEEPHHSF